MSQNKNNSPKKKAKPSKMNKGPKSTVPRPKNRVEIGDVGSGNYWTPPARGSDDY